MTCLDCRPGRPCAECAARGNATSGCHGPTCCCLRCLKSEWARRDAGKGRLANGAWLGETLVADIIESLSVRAGEVLTPDVIEERARNIAAALLGKYEIKERT